MNIFRLIGNFVSMKKIITILAAIGAIVCSCNVNTPQGGDLNLNSIDREALSNGQLREKNVTRSLRN